MIVARSAGILIAAAAVLEVAPALSREPPEARDHGEVVGAADDVAGRCVVDGANLVRNGSFEEPPRRPEIHFRIVTAGEHIGPWSVSGGAVDHIAPHFWEAAHGEQSLDVNSCGPATVSQRVPTRPGDSYQLCFALAGNSEAAPARKRLAVLWEGEIVATVEFDASHTRRARMEYRYHRYVVRASGHDAVLAFRSLTPGCYGPVLDDVTLQRIPDPVASGVRRRVPGS